MSADGAHLQLDVMGAGPAYSNRIGSTGASYLVRSGGTAILLDLGQGSFPRLAATIEPSTLDAVVISHLHPDHFVDLVALRHYLRWYFEVARRVRVIAPMGLEARLDALHDEPGFSRATLAIEPIAEGSIEIGSLRLEARGVTHSGDSHAFRVDRAERSGPGLVYSGDCGRADDLAPLIRAGDGLLCEVSFGPGPVPAGAAHLDGPAVGSLGARTRVGRILLTHLQMGFDRDATIDAVRSAYDGPSTFVDPGSRITIAG
jgi:ribonuclease BN (tRNA processing enzyme)